MLFLINSITSSKMKKNMIKCGESMERQLKPFKELKSSKDIQINRKKFSLNKWRMEKKNLIIKLLNLII